MTHGTMLRTEKREILTLQGELAMPLRDHFRSPVNDTHSWDEVHGQWPGEIVRTLTTILPAGFRAAPNIHLGSSFEVDVSAHESDAGSSKAVTDSGEGSTATTAALNPTL